MHVFCLFLRELIHRPSHFLIFSCVPATCPNYSKAVTASSISWAFFQNRVVSSAYWIILTTFVLWSSRLKPVMLSFCLIKFDRISIHSINNNDEIWHPCLTPRVKRNSCDKCPLFFINALGFVYRILIHCWSSVLMVSSWLSPGNKTFLQVASMVVKCWIVISLLHRGLSTSAIQVWSASFV